MDSQLETYGKFVPIEDLILLNGTSIRQSD